MTFFFNHLTVISSSLSSVFVTCRNSLKGLDVIKNTNEQHLPATDRSTKVFHRKYLNMKLSKSEASRQLKNMLLKIKLLFIFTLG